MNDPLKQKEVVGRVRELKINLVCLIETRVKENKMNAIISRHFQGWQMVHNYSEVAHNGRIWLLWNGIQVDLVESMDQSITCGVLFGLQRFYLSVVYGSNEGIERRRLWSHLLALKGSITQGPWIHAGDFNVIVHHSESSKYTDSQSANIKEFQTCLQALAVFDHVFSGPMFTWSNHQDETFVAKKLDRVLISDNWHLEFEHSSVDFLPPGISDHSPMLVQMDRGFAHLLNLSIFLIIGPNTLFLLHWWKNHGSSQCQALQ